MAEFVTPEQCEAYRDCIYKVDTNQEVRLGRLDAEVSIIKTLMFSILGVLVSGFIGTIFAVLSLR